MPHTRGVPCGVAESTLKVWYFKGMPASLRLEWELRREEDKLPGHLGREVALASSELAPLLAGTCRQFVSLRQEGRFDVSPKSKDEAMEG